MDLLDDIHRFSTLTPEQKHALVTKLTERSRTYRLVPVICDRRDKRLCPKPSSHLSKKDLMMIGELTQEEVDDIISPSMENSLRMWDMDYEDEEDTLTEEYLRRFIDQCNLEEEEEEEEEGEEYYVPQTFEEHLLSTDINELTESLSVLPSYSREDFEKRMPFGSAGIANTFERMGITEEDLAGMNADSYKLMMAGLSVVPSHHREDFVKRMIFRYAGKLNTFVWKGGSTENLIGMDAKEYLSMMESLRRQKK